MKTLKKIFTIAIITSMQLVSYAQETNISSTDSSINENYCKVQGLFYTVKIGVYNTPVSNNIFPSDVHQIYCIKQKNGLFAYFSGTYDCRFIATEKRFDVVSKGIHNAHVSVYYNGKEISISHADALIAENGEAILFNSYENQLAYQENE